MRKFIKKKIEGYFEHMNRCHLDIVYIIILVSLAGYMAVASGRFFPAVLFMVAFTGLMLAARYLAKRKGTRYLLAYLALFTFLYMVHLYSMPYVYKTVLNKWTFLVLLFLILLEDYITPLLAGGYAVVRILMLFPDAKPFTSAPGDITRGQVMGNANGMIMTTILSVIIYHILKKLIDERNKFRNLSNTDSLTGLANFAYTINTARKMLQKGPVSILIADMDRFKQVNDTYGHIAGNKVLIEVAEVITKETEGLERIVGRLGGDEFIIAVENDGSEKVLGLSEHLLNTMKDRLFIVDPELDPVNLSFSIGQANSTSTEITVEKLLHMADINMYYNKYKNHRLNIFINKEKPILPKEGYELLNVLAEKDMYTYVHSGYTAQYAAALGRELGLPEEKVEALYAAGWLHDMGKILVSSDIVRKNGKLNEEEYQLIKSHVNYGLNVLQNLPLSKEAIHCIQCHHERWDGKGYPNSLSAEKIPFEARILQIADSYSAMTIKRVYRKTLSPEEALKEIKKSRGKQFDPKLVDVFERLINKKMDAA